MQPGRPGCELHQIRCFVAVHDAEHERGHVLARDLGGHLFAKLVGNVADACERRFIIEIFTGVGRLGRYTCDELGAGTTATSASASINGSSCSASA